MDIKDLNKLKDRAQKAVAERSGGWPFHLQAFKRDIEPEQVLELIELASRATSPAPAVVQMTDEQIECDIRSEFELWGNKYGLNAKYVQGACWDAWQSCSSIWQARMNALGAAPAANLAAAILALPLMVNPHVFAGWTRQEQDAHDAGVRAMREAAAALAKQVPAQEQVPIELVGVKETISEGDGFWQPCSGCYDTEDGHPTRNYEYSEFFQSAMGCGCSECGGLGVVWDNNDYAAMYDEEEAAQLAQSADTAEG